MTALNSGQPSTILLLEPDDDTRPLLKGNLENQGYRVLISLDEPDAIFRAANNPFIDLILVNQVSLSAESVIAQAQRIRREASLSESVPVVILAENYTEDLEGQNIQVAEHEYIAYLENVQQLLDLLADLLNKA